MTHDRQRKAALAIGSALVLMAGFAIFVPSFAADPAAAEQSQPRDSTDPDSDEPATQANPESSGDTKSSAVPPTSASIRAGASQTASAAVNEGGGVPMSLLAIAGVAVACLGLSMWRRRPDRGRSGRRRNATGAKNSTRETQPF